MADTLTFGPEWLRALSDGNSVTSPPPSPGMPKYKLSEHRYVTICAIMLRDSRMDGLTLHYYTAMYWIHKVQFKNMWTHHMDFIAHIHY